MITKRSLLRRRKTEDPFADVRGEPSAQGQRELPELSKKDIVAVIIALFQLFMPLVIGLVIVGVLVTLLLRLT